MDRNVRRLHRLLPAAALLLAGCCITMTRLGFARPSRMVQPGMTKAEVQRVLGPPQHITIDDPDMHLETWEYPDRMILFHYDSLFSWEDASVPTEQEGR